MAEPSDVEDEIRRLVEEGCVEQARARVRLETEQGWGEAVRAWAVLLAPPTAERRPRSGRGDIDLNRAWLEQHEEEHLGEWVALRDGALVDSDPSFRALQERLRAVHLEGGVLLTRVEGRGEAKTGT